MSEEKIYHRGTDSQFDAFEAQAKIEQNIPVDGKIGYCCGVLVPDYQRTMEYSWRYQHPTILNDNIWLFGQYKNLVEVLPELTREEAIAEGFFPDEDV